MKIDYKIENLEDGDYEIEIMFVLNKLNCSFDFILNNTFLSFCNFCSEVQESFLNYQPNNFNYFQIESGEYDKITFTHKEEVMIINNNGTKFIIKDVAKILIVLINIIDDLSKLKEL